MCICVVVLVRANPTELHRNSHEEHDMASGKRTRGRKVGTQACCLIGSTFDLKASHLPEEDGAEQEDGIEKQQTQAQPAIQPPVVQMNTHHLRAERKR